uniref:5'-nucleotidase n=1 Tax=Tetraselmis sp. GSL018 TaxID=582737 RepID=A0A061QQ45_9CHLO
MGAGCSRSEPFCGSICCDTAGNNANQAKAKSDLIEPVKKIEVKPAGCDSSSDLKAAQAEHPSSTPPASKGPVESKDPASSAKRTSTLGLNILHFNDVYNIDSREQEPCGGAARFVTKALQKAEEFQAMTLFSGDCLNPSLLSTVTSGWHMAPVLNALNIHTACLGNHDFDFGLENLSLFLSNTNFPWLMANVLDPNTRKPLGGAKPSRLVRVGLLGLVEREWLETLACIDISEVLYIDFVDEGRRIAKDLIANGAQVVIALTHMRVPNDMRLAAEVPEIDLILGGHDHHYEAGPVGPHNTWLVKSGTDFRDLSLIQLALQPEHTGGRPTVKCEHIQITSDIEEHRETAETVAHYMSKLGEAMDEVVGETAVDLDGRFKVVRTQESNLGNFVCDCWRLASGADLVILNSGTLRSDAVHPKGPLKMQDLVSILPMLDETVVLEASGSVIMQALENGVSKWPALEGRFLQVSGVRFDFDPSQPPGSRIDPDTVFIQGKPIGMDRKYRLGTKAYMAQGKDGFDCLMGLKELVRADEGTLLPTTVREHFRHLTTLMHPEYLERVQAGSIPVELDKAPRSVMEVYLSEASKGALQDDDPAMKRSASSATFNQSIVSFDEERKLFLISPEVNQRIVCLQTLPADG